MVDEKKLAEVIRDRAAEIDDGLDSAQPAVAECENAEYDQNDANERRDNNMQFTHTADLP